MSDAIGNHVSHWHVSDTHFVRLRRHLPVSLEFADALIAARFERYLKTGSGRAFAKRHFGDESAKKGIILKACCSSPSRVTTLRRYRRRAECDRSPGAMSRDIEACSRVD